MTLELDENSGTYILKDVPMKIEKDLMLLHWENQQDADWYHDDEEKVKATIACLKELWPEYNIDIGNIVL